MSTASASKPEVFTRKASGLVRVMSPFSAFIYNVLTMGLTFPPGPTCGRRVPSRAARWSGVFYWQW